MPLVQIADSVRDLPGRKIVIWIGYGYPSVPTEHMNKQQAKAVQTMLHDVTDRLLRARVTVNIIDPEGTIAHDISTTDVVYQDVAARMIDQRALGSSASYGQELGPFSGAFNFEKFATASDGHLIKGRNDIEAPVERTTQDGTKYYSLSYTPTSGSDASQDFRKIRVVARRTVVNYRDSSLRSESRPLLFQDSEEGAECLRAPSSTRRVSWRRAGWGLARRGVFQ